MCMLSFVYIRREIQRVPEGQFGISRSTFSRFIVHSFLLDIADVYGSLFV